MDKNSPVGNAVSERVSRTEHPAGERLAKGTPAEERRTEALTGENSTGEAPTAVEPKKSGGVFHEILKLVLKILIIVLIFMLAVTFLFGGTTLQTDSMTPSFEKGDRVIYYRLDKNYVATNCVAIRYNGRTEVLRVVAVAGDTVDLNENGLYINGSLQSEPDHTKETLPVPGGPKYPLKLQKGEVFLLGDNRPEAVDSRTFGQVQAKKTLGEMMTLIRSVKEG